MGRYLHPDVAWVPGPCAGALYDRRDGRVYPVDALGATLIEDHLTTETDLDTLAARASDPAQGHWLAALRDSPLSETRPAAPARRSLHGVAAARHKLLWLELTNQCNYRCLHCYADSDPEPRETLPDARWFALLDEAAELGFGAVQLTGGDPLLHPRWLDFVEHAHIRGIPTVEVYTNASMFKTHQLERLAALGTHVAVSFYSADPATYEAITGSRGLFERVLQNLEQMVALRIPVRIGFIEMDDNRGHAPAAIALLTKLGIDPQRIHIDGVRPTGRGVELQSSGCGTAQGTPMVGLERLTGETAAKPPIWRAPMSLPQYFHVRGDNAVWNSCWEGELVVDPDGDVFPCIFARDHVLGNVAQRPLARVAQAESVQTTWAHNLGDSDDCSVCEFRFACFDCRALTANVAGRVTAKPPSCIYDPHTGQFDWARWFAQHPDLDAMLACVPQAATMPEVVCEDADYIMLRCGGAVATVTPLAAALLDLADGTASLGELAALIAATRDEPVSLWQRPVITQIWELAQRGLLYWHDPATAAIPA